MATTAIWPIRGRLDRAIAYIKDQEKTYNPAWEQRGFPALSSFMQCAIEQAAAQGMGNTINYVTDGEKTDYQYYVSGIRCDPQSAREAMSLTKRRFQKEGGIVLFHGYQSFKPGEVTPEQAHEIGVELANRLWGDRFEVVIATHLNTGVLHNHFILNSVSCVDGKRFYANKATYAQMRRVSDDLCRLRGLSVIAQENGRSQHYGQWIAEQAGAPTWRSAIRADVDRAIAQSMTWNAFLRLPFPPGTAGIWNQNRRKAYGGAPAWEGTLCAPSLPGGRIYGGSHPKPHPGAKASRFAPDAACTAPAGSDTRAVPPHSPGGFGYKGRSACAKSPGRAFGLCTITTLCYCERRGGKIAPRPSFCGRMFATCRLFPGKRNLCSLHAGYFPASAISPPICHRYRGAAGGPPGGFRRAHPAAVHGAQTASKCAAAQGPSRGTKGGNRGTAPCHPRPAESIAGGDTPVRRHPHPIRTDQGES